VVLNPTEPSTLTTFSKNAFGLLQPLCTNIKLLQALQPFRWLLQWAFSRVVWLAMQINLFPSWVLSNDDGKYKHPNPFSVVI
jgi:hypothetical protein